QLLHHRRGTLDHFAGGDLVGDSLGKNVNLAHGICGRWPVASVTDSWAQRKGGLRLAVTALTPRVSYSFSGSAGMKHAILGAGAIGGLVGTALASLGDDVTVVVRPEKLSSFPRSLVLERPSGSLTASAKAVATLTEPVDVLWIA